MIEIYPVLAELRDKLATIAGVTTCKIGLEAGLSPDDYPIIRLVPVKISRIDQSKVKMELTIYFGQNLTEADQGLEAVYQNLLDFEKLIKEAIKFGNGYKIHHLDTITDEDRLEHFKIFASRFEVVG